MTTLYRATSDGYRGVWSCWSCQMETAEAYRDNPGFGGSDIITADVDEDGYILDLRGESDPMLALAEAVFESLGRREAIERFGLDSGFDDIPAEPCDLARRWADRGLSLVYECWENDTVLRDVLPECWDWVVHDQESYPERATTWVRLA